MAPLKCGTSPLKNWWGLEKTPVIIIIIIIFQLKGKKSIEIHLAGWRFIVNQVTSVFCSPLLAWKVIVALSIEAVIKSESMSALSLDCQKD